MTQTAIPSRTIAAPRPAPNPGFEHGPGPGPGLVPGVVPGLSVSANLPLRPAETLGNYILGQTLGEGEFGKVKLGWPARPRARGPSQVAIKIIRRESVATRAKQAKVQREITVLQRCNHPNIVRCFEVVTDRRCIGIILEYASGGELFDFILTHRYLKDPMACRLFAQLISAVGYLHSKGIVHRDLKLENLLLDRNRNIIVTDFGFANEFDPRSGRDLMQTSCGSPCYAAPELVVSDALYCGRKVDVWSCGVILYAMLAGYLPFDDDPANPEGDNINLLYRYITTTPLTFPEYVTPLARDLLRRVLVPDPAKRALLRDVISHPWLAPQAKVLLGPVDPTPQQESRSAPLPSSHDMLRSSSEDSPHHRTMPVTNHLSMVKPLQPTTGNLMGPPPVAKASLAIAATPAMIRSATITGADALLGSIPAPVPSRTARLPAPRTRPRPTSYHPGFGGVLDGESSRLQSSGAASVSSWKTGSSPKSTRMHAEGELSRPEKTEKAARRMSVPLPGNFPQDNPPTLPLHRPQHNHHHQHRRGQSSITSMLSVFGKLWTPGNQSEESTQPTPVVMEEEVPASGPSVIQHNTATLPSPSSTPTKRGHTRTASSIAARRVIQFFTGRRRPSGGT